MIELFYWPTPNGHKITLFLEEADVPAYARGDFLKPRAQLDEAECRVLFAHGKARAKHKIQHKGHEVHEGTRSFSSLFF